MNPLVEKMLSLTNEVQTLEQIFEHEAKCQCKHIAEDNKVCSTRVTHSVSIACAQQSLNVCTNTVRVYTTWMQSGDKCQTCRDFCSTCWTIRPI